MSRHYSKEVRIFQSLAINILIVLFYGFDKVGLLCGALIGWGSLLFNLYVDYLQELTDE